MGGGLGLNLSKSGISPSYRTKFGSVGPKQFTIRTGIPASAIAVVAEGAAKVAKAPSSFSYLLRQWLPLLLEQSFLECLEVFGMGSRRNVQIWR